MTRSVLPSEALLLEYLQIAAIEGWADLARAVVRRRALHQEAAVREVRSVDAMWQTAIELSGLDRALADSTAIRIRAWESLAVPASDPHAVAQAMLDDFAERLETLSPDQRDRVDDLLAQRHRQLIAGADHGEANRGLIGLALSGGGIRSASFSIGVLQALARSSVLSALHYVSAVSGGGYAASWIVTWAYRHQRGVEGVQDELFRSGNRCGPLHWVRRYGSYLAHHLGPLSTDAWALLVAYLRNWAPVFVLVVISLVPLALLPHLWAGLSTKVPPMWIGLLATSTTVAFIGLLRYLMLFRRVSPEAPQTGRVRLWVAMWSLAAALALSRMIADRERVLLLLRESHQLLDIVLADRAGVLSPLAGVLIYLSGLGLAAILRHARRQRGPDVHARMSTYYALRATTVGGLVFGATLELCIHVLEPLRGSMEATLTAAPLLIALSIGLAETSMIMLTTDHHDDDDRAWQAQVGGWVLGTMIVWTVLSLVSLWLWKMVSALPYWTLSVPFAVWVLCVAVPWRDRRISAALVWSALVPLALLTALAYIVDLVAVRHAPASPWLLGVIVVVSLGLAYVGSTVVDINYFSLHDIYRERLTRTFLGASRLAAQNANIGSAVGSESGAEQVPQFGRRTPTGFTNIDENDSPGLHWLRSTKQRPLPVILLNAAVNGRSRSEHGGREPRQWSFSFSPYFCGSPASGIGYRKTDCFFPHYEGKGLTLGAAMALSGAAVSPTAGRMTHPVKALLFGLLNARLGMWVINPRHASRKRDERFRSPGPALGLLKELLSFRPFFSRWIHLSDGGHFENLGVFELLRRGCSRIVVVDASCDPERSFDDLANAIRRARIDLGIEIRRSEPWSVFGPDAPLPQSDLDPRRSWMWFDIDYGEHAKHHPIKGRLLYIKPSVYSGQVLPPDVIQYWQGAPRFPHETTADQFFTEAQMEAYRALGETCARSALDEIVKGPAGPEDDPPLRRALLRRRTKQLPD
jgi:hypothetical protein